MYHRVMDDFCEEDDDVLHGLTLAQITRPLTPTSTACNGGRFDKDLNNDEWIRFKSIQNTFNFYKKSDKCQTEFDSAYDQADNPYVLALKFFVQGTNYQDCKAKSFTFYVLEAFKLHIAKRPDRHHLLDDSLRQTAFTLTNKDPNGSLLKISSAAFRFADSSHLFEESVRKMIREHKYVTAAKLAELTGQVQDDFVYAFLVPIAFSRGQTNILYEYLEMAKPLQVPLVQALDQLMTDNADELCRELVLRYNYQNIPKENLNLDYLRKNLPKLRKRFEVPIEATPNTANIQKQGALEFWIRKMAMGEADLSVFDDNIKTLVSQDDVQNQVTLITKLLQFRLGMDCVKWMRYFSMSQEDLPPAIRNRIREAERIQSKMGPRLQPPKERNVYDASIQEVFVSNATSFEQMMVVLNDPGVEILAFDVELKPVYNESAPMALLQVAIPTAAFVVDKLSTDISTEMWHRLGAVFNRPTIVKLGFGCHDDVARLGSVLNLSKNTIADVVDFFRLWNLLDSDAEFKEVVKPLHSVGGSGLKDLVKAFLGKNLDKRMQMSDWGLRPLRKEQIRYAALDAFALVEVYLDLQRRLALKRISVDELLEKYKKKYRGRMA